MQTVRLSITPGVVNPGAYLSQYDVGRQIKFLLFDDTGAYTPAAGSTVKIRATKPSGFGFDVACTWSQNAVTVTVIDDMSSEAGSFGAELRITKDDEIIGTCNFLWNVERSPHQNDVIDGGGAAEELMQELIDAADAANDAAVAANDAADAAEAAAADATAAASGALTEALKTALLQIAQKVVYVDDDGPDYYTDLYAALYAAIPATSITLNKQTLFFTETGDTETLVATVLPADTTDNVVWSTSDSSVVTVTSGGVVAAVGYGLATVLARAGAKTATCSIIVAQATVESIEATFNQGTATIYETDSLDFLKQYLTVIATYSNTMTETIPGTDYTLSGTLEEGTSTITVTYEGKTDTFDVTVSASATTYSITNNLSHVASSNAGVTRVEEGDSYLTSLGIESGYTLSSVTVTMGGTDITESVYNTQTRMISIASVTGNIVITATAVSG